MRMNNVEKEEREWMEGRSSWWGGSAKRGWGEAELDPRSVGGPEWAVLEKGIVLTGAQEGVALMRVEDEWYCIHPVEP